MKNEMTSAEYRAMLAKRPAPRDDREHQEQVALFEWAALNEARLPELALLFAIPNGGDRHPAVAAKLKAEGVKAGVPDLFLPVARDGYHGLWIELKAPGGTLADHQSDWLTFLSQQGYLTTTCYGWTAAARRIVAYLGGHFAECGL
jgi:hypothetical protein